MRSPGTTQHVKFAQMPSVVKFHEQFFGESHNNTRRKRKKFDRAMNKIV